MEFELKEPQIDKLRRLRDHKRSFLLKAFIGFLFMLVVSFAPIILITLSSEVSGSTWFGRHKYQLLGGLVIAGILYLIIHYFFIKTVVPLNKDIRLKEGIIEKHQIIRKQHFPLTNDFFFFFAEHKIPNIPVDAITFGHYQQGDYYTVHRAKYSKVVFEDLQREEINTEHEFDGTGLNWLYDGVADID